LDQEARIVPGLEPFTPTRIRWYQRNRVTQIRKIKAIITDLDGVIRIFPESHVEKIEHKYSIPSGSIMSCAFSNEDLDLVVAGKISDAQWRDNIARRLSQVTPPGVHSRVVISEWSDFAGILNSEVLDIYRKIKKDKKLVLMTNATDRLVKDLKTLGVDGEFDLIINSSALGFAKPDKQIFNFALKELKLDAKEIVFIDDSQRIVLKAQEMGFYAHQYKNLKEFYDFCLSIP
jgi:FMN phosphatase YigB (HAD superfamily)